MKIADNVADLLAGRHRDHDRPRTRSRGRVDADGTNAGRRRPRSCVGTDYDHQCQEAIVDVTSTPPLRHKDLGMYRTARDSAGAQSKPGPQAAGYDGRINGDRGAPGPRTPTRAQAREREKGIWDLVGQYDHDEADAHALAGLARGVVAPYACMERIKTPSRKRAVPIHQYPRRRARRRSSCRRLKARGRGEGGGVHVGRRFGPRWPVWPRTPTAGDRIGRAPQAATRANVAGKRENGDARRIIACVIRRRLRPGACPGMRGRS